MLDHALKYYKQGLSVIPVGKNKRPIVEWKKYQKSRATPEQITKWFTPSGSNPVPNIGIVTGEVSRMVVIDVEKGGETTYLPATTIVKTGGGGWHYYYKYDPSRPIPNSTRIRPLTDIRGEGGYVVAPPSKHQSGLDYEFAIQNGLQPFPHELFPQAIEKPQNDWSEIVKGTPHGNRNDMASKMIGKQLSIYQPTDWETVVWPTIQGWNKGNTPPLPESELRATFDSIADREKSKLTNPTAQKDLKLQTKLIANTVITKLGTRLLYCSEWDRFLLYNGKYYKYLENDDLRRKIAVIMLEINHKWDTKLSNIDDAFRLIKLTLPKSRRVRERQLAHDSFAFNDGLFNSTTFEQLPFDPDILTFKYIDVDMVKFDDPSPNFQNYLSSTFVDKRLQPDATLRDLFQEMIGAIFSQKKEARKVFFLKGSGDNGKSVATDLLIDIFGRQFVTSASLQTLTNNQFGKSCLVGKILNICSEEESKYVNNDAFKVLVTGEQVQAERKFESHFEFANQARFIFATNDSPSFTKLDKAMKKRIIIIPFNYTFTRSEQDIDLHDKLVTEMSPIVGFALRGLQRLRDNKFSFTDSPESVQELADMEENISSAVAFLNENYELISDKDIPKPLIEIYTEYDSWCEENGHKYPNNNRNFAKIMRDQFGAIDKKTREGVMFYVKRKNSEGNVGTADDVPDTSIPF